jgi:sortase B
MKSQSNQKNHSENKKTFSSRLFYLFVYLVLIGIFLFSGYRVFDYVMEGKKQSDLNQSIIEEAVIQKNPIQSQTEEELLPATEIIPEEEKKAILLHPDISVDLAAVKSRYPNAVGWLYCPDTVLHYPIMQADDNQFYVDRLPNGVKNANGSLFLDCRNDSALSDWNQIIYGHNMINRSMFGTLMDYRKAEYFQEHPFMFYFTDNQIYRLEIFSGVHTIATSLFYQIPTTQEQKEAFLSAAKSHSVFASEVSVSVEDRIMVLSTCSGRVNEDKRFVVIAKLVPLL